MPNRIIKESICISASIDLLSDKAENLFYRLIVNCDDYGRIDGRPIIIQTKCYPLRMQQITLPILVDLLIELANANLINIYLNSNKPFIQITTWDKHQQIRAKKSKYPPFDNTCNRLISNAIREQLLSDNKCTRNPIQSNPIESVIQSMQENIDNGNGHKEIATLSNTEVLANKEVIEIPKNKEVTYVKTDDEGNPVKEKPPKKIKKETKWGIQIGEVFKFLDSFRGYKPTKRNAEAAAIIRMLDKNYTVQQIIDVWKQMKSNDFRFRDRELYMMSVENDIGAKLAVAKPKIVDNADKFTQGKLGKLVQK